MAEAMAMYCSTFGRVFDRSIRRRMGQPQRGGVDPGEHLVQPLQFVEIDAEALDDGRESSAPAAQRHTIGGQLDMGGALASLPRDRD
jgi:hypothetical protein